MKSFQFWLYWLYVTIAMIILYGLGLVFFSQSIVFDLLINHAINTTFWGTAAATPDIVLFQRFIYCVLGATVAGWGIMMAFVVYNAFRRQEKWAWLAMAWAMVVWYIPDTGYSVYFQATINAIINTLLLAAIGLPLVMTRKMMHN